MRPITELIELWRRIDHDCELLNTPTFDKILVNYDRRREFLSHYDPDRQFMSDGKFSIPSWRRNIPVIFTSEVEDWELVGVLSLHVLPVDRTVVTAKQAQYR